VVAARLTGCKNIVPARRVTTNRLSVELWRCELHSTVPVPESLTHIGVRSHQIAFQQPTESENTFPCWLVNSSEAPHEMTLYLRLHNAPREGDAAHLQADISKQAWRTLSAQPQPWRITLDPERLLLLQD
jgi:molybdate transport system permease protein